MHDILWYQKWIVYEGTVGNVHNEHQNIDIYNGWNIKKNYGDKYHSIESKQTAEQYEKWDVKNGDLNLHWELQALSYGTIWTITDSVYYIDKGINIW